MSNLSPSAQAVKDAVLATYSPDLPPNSIWALEQRGVAAAIRALAYNVYSDEIVTCGGSSYALVIERDDILAIADELEETQ